MKKYSALLAALLASLTLAACDQGTDVEATGETPGSAVQGAAPTTEPAEPADSAVVVVPEPTPDAGTGSAGATPGTGTDQPAGGTTQATPGTETPPADQTQPGAQTQTQ